MDAMRQGTLKTTMQMEGKMKIVEETRKMKAPFSKQNKKTSLVEEP